MTYDNYGNIKTKNGIEYTYGNSSWKDLLTKVGNQEISYDNQGNPINYLGHTLTWEKGRQLKAFDTNTYTYNANGIRTSKTVNGIVHNYTLEGTKILKEVLGNNILVPLYDNEEILCGIEYNGNAFYFVRNLQNDIIAITDKDGETVARYTYDAWGVCTIAEDTSEVGIAAVNPYRYRSYYYDTEIGMYYLQSRYYDPTVGRFINADVTDYLGINNILVGYNLFNYCENNPVNQKDDLGFIASVVGGAIIGAFIAAISYLVEYWIGMRDFSWWALIGIVAAAAALGAIGGYISGWVKFAKIAKRAKLPWLFKKLKSPLVRNIVTWAVRGIKFIINGFIKSLSRKPGESWKNTIRRWLNI